LFFGFNLGPIAYKLWNRRRPMIETLDDVSSGKVNVTEKAGEAFKGMVNAASQSAATTLRELRTVAASPEPTAEKPSVEVAATSTPAIPTPDAPAPNWREKINKYTGKGGAS